MDELAQVPDEVKSRSDDGSNSPGESSRVKALVDATPSEQLQAHYRHDYQSLVGRARTIVRSTEAAEDVVQEAYSRTVSAIRHGTEIRELGPYLNSCVRNLSFRYVKRKATLPLNEDISYTGADSPHDLVQRRQQYEAVCRSMSGLAPAQKSALYLAEIRGMAYSEIADSMHKPETAVRQLISRARNRVRETAGPRSLSIFLPLLLGLDAEARAGLPFWTQVRVLFTWTRINIVGKIAELQRSTGAILGNPADLVSQPATAFMAGALTVTALTISEPVKSTSGQKVEIGSLNGALLEPKLAPVDAVFAKQKRDVSSSKSARSTSDSLPLASAEDPLVSYIPPSLGDIGGGPADAGRGEDTSRHGDGTRAADDLDEAPDDDGDSPETSPTPTPAPGGGSGGGGSDSGSVVVAPANTAVPSISGGSYVGQTLSAANGTWSGSDPTSISYQWRRSGTAISGATSSTYTLVTADAGNAIGVAVTFANGGGSATATSGTIAAIGVPTSVPPNSVVTVPAPPATVGQTVTALTFWANAVSVSYAWRRNGIIFGGPPGNMYPLVAADAGTNIDAVATATNPAGSTSSVTDSIAVMP